MFKKLLLIGSGLLVGAFVVEVMKASCKRPSAMKEDELDRMIEQSFPASDPPAYF